MIDCRPFIIVVDEATPAIERVARLLDDLEWFNPEFREILQWVPE